MYMSATASFITTAQLEPDSNQTSMMSNSLRKFCAPQFWHFTLAGTMSFTLRVYHASAPCAANSLTTASFASFERRGKRSRSEEHTSELQSLAYLVCRLLLEKKKKKKKIKNNTQNNTYIYINRKCI